ncbi:hypothetical protein E1295_09155 [Nonomuraea mesophila]|uniref:DUF3800 domain-containing protein n=1 Tax=Nonomuraea mesophila TaxID=2530382 RepID=A0A4R5FUR1_9ACTN|nr:hypothetical protein [Nonomuraea mesophila]TDE56994.1 hypothetical protein E1295_09155 [Nonomuraea mesophila]
MPESPEVTCDESGAEGEKLVGGNTNVFAHAAILMSRRAAEECIGELRARAPTPAGQYAACHVLRGKHRATLTWLLGPSGPLLGRAHVFLADKPFLAVRKIVALIDDGHVPGIGLDLDPRTSARALTLYREGPRAFGPARWTAFLDSFNYLLRAKNGQGVTMSVDDAFLLVDELRGPGPAGEVMELLWQARPQVAAFRERLLRTPHVFPALDPLIPAIVRAVQFWDRGEPVRIVHDRQTTLTDERIARLRQILDGRLAALRPAESSLDLRVQLADVVVGLARRIAEDELTGQGDPVLTALLRPYVDERSIWGDARSGAMLGQHPDAVMSG